MEYAGYLVSAQEVVGGKVRRYYETTDPGREVLEGLKQKVRELTHEVLGHDAAAPARTSRRSR